MITKQRLIAALGALVVVLTVTAGPAAAADSPVFPSSDANGLIVEVSWDSASVTPGDTVRLNIDDVTAGTTADTATVTVRNAGGTDTYWLPMSEYEIPTSVDATTEVDIVLDDPTTGSVGILRVINGETGSQTLSVAPDEGISTNLTLDDGLPADYQPVNITVSAYDGGTTLGSTTVAAETASPTYAEINSSELELSSTANVTVVVTGATPANGGTEYTALTTYTVSKFGDAHAGGAGGGGSSDSSTIWYVLVGAAVVGALLIMRE